MYVNVLDSKSLGWRLESSVGVRRSRRSCHHPCSLPIWHAHTIGRKRPNRASLEPWNLRRTWKVNIQDWWLSVYFCFICFIWVILKQDRYFLCSTSSSTILHYGVVLKRTDLMFLMQSGCGVRSTRPVYFVISRGCCNRQQSSHGRVESLSYLFAAYSDLVCQLSLLYPMFAVTVSEAWPMKVKHE